MIEILHEHIRESIPIVYTFYGCYDIDQMIEGPYFSYNYIILTWSPGVGDSAYTHSLNEETPTC